MARLIAVLLLVLAALGLVGPAAASAWPTRPVRLVVAYPPGGPTDLVGRLYAAKLTELYGQPVVVENRPGANGNIAAQLVAKAPADGTTFLMHASSVVINTLLYKNIGYDVMADFTPVSQLFDYKLVVVVHPSVPITSVKELVAQAREKPGTITFASGGGAGAPTHLSVEMFKQIAGIDLVHVPYAGGAPATTDLLSGHVMLMFNNPTQSIPHIKAGKLRGLAVTGLTRHPQVPELPTLDELGYTGFDVGTWFGLWAPAKLPGDIVTAVHQAIARIATMADVKERHDQYALNVIAGTPDQLARIMRTDLEQWGKVIRAANITVD
jgi:tripartite-type tricarboxylate transporter receptor subunit TctC